MYLQTVNNKHLMSRLSRLTVGQRRRRESRQASIASVRFIRACSKKLWGNMNISRRTEAAAVQTAFAANRRDCRPHERTGPRPRATALCLRQVLLAICASPPLACVAHPSIPICQQSQTTSAKNRLQFNLMMIINIYLAFNSPFFFFFFWADFTTR